MADPNETYVGDDGVTYYVNPAWDRPGTWQNAMREGRLPSHLYGKAKGLLDDPEMPWNAQSGLLAFLDTAAMPAKAVTGGLLALPDRMNSVTQSAQSGDYYPALEDAMSVAFSGLPIGTAAAPSGVAGMMAGKLPRAAKAAEAALPMDEASRMARAAEMGFDTPAWHVTPNDVAAFDLGRASPTAKWGRAVYLTTDQKKLPLLERSVAARAGADDGVNVMPVMVRMSAPYDAAVHGGPVGQMLSEKMSARGFDGVVDGAQLAVFDPRNIRSRFAAFDPARRDSADLLASVGGPGGLLGLAALNRDEEKRK